MPTDIIVNTVPQLGVSGVALWILWKMYDSSSSRLKEKDSELIVEIDKRDRRLEEHEKSFRAYAAKVHESQTQQINENTKALKESAAIMQEAMVHLSSTRTVVNQIKVEPNK